jgi:hypothetical protein
MSSVSSHSRIVGPLVGIAAAAFAAAGLAGQPGEVLVDHDRVTEERTNMPPREGPLQPIHVQTLRNNGCPGRLDALACANMNVLAPHGAGEIVGTGSAAAGTLTTGGQEVTTFGRK